MLFDLRSRGRRRTVQAVYLLLAILLGGGLVLFGVGAGNGLGGLLNAFNGGGSTSGQKAVVSQQEKQAIKQTQQTPNEPAGLGEPPPGALDLRRPGRRLQLLHRPVHQVRPQRAEPGARRTGSTTSSSRRTPIPTSPSSPPAPTPASRTTPARPAPGTSRRPPTRPRSRASNASPVSAYAAGQTRKGDLASAKALSLVPKAQQALLKNQLNAAKTQPSVAQQC